MNGWTKNFLLVVFSFGLLLSHSFEVRGFDTSKIIVNIPALELSLFQNEKLIYRFPIAVGSPVYETPVGPMELKQIVWNPWWFPPTSAWAMDDHKTPPGPTNPLGPVKMELEGNIRMHGTNNEQSVGHAVSHGCIRMLNEDAKTLAWWVQSHYSQKNNPSLLTGYPAQKDKSYYVVLNTPLLVDIRYDLVEVGDNVLKIHPDIYQRIGNLKELVYALFEEHGVDTKQINKHILKHFLASLKKETISISLKELISDNQLLAWK